MISEVIKEFCNQYGLKGVSMEEGGKLRLSIEGIGDLQFLHQKNKLLVGLTRKIENYYLFSGRKVLAMCHYKEPHFHPLHAQLNDDMLGIFYLFDENEVTAALLSQALDALTETMDSMLK